MKTIPKEKWLQIYVALKLIKFYSYITEQKLIKNVRDIYKQFNDLKFQNDNDKNEIDSIPNTLSLIYLLIVRTIEILDQYLDDEFSEVKNEIWEQIKTNLQIQTFEDVLVKFEITIIDNKLPERWRNGSETDKFFGFLSNVRNSISHWRYEINSPIVTLKDRPNKNAPDNFHVEIFHYQLLNYTDTTISTIHDLLQKTNRIQ